MKWNVEILNSVVGLNSPFVISRLKLLSCRFGDICLCLRNKLHQLRFYLGHKYIYISIKYNELLLMISYIAEIVQSMITFSKMEHVLNILKANVLHKDLIAFYFKTTKCLVSL